MLFSIKPFPSRGGAQEIERQNPHKIFCHDLISVVILSYQRKSLQQKILLTSYSESYSNRTTLPCTARIHMVGLHKPQRTKFVSFNTFVTYWDEVIQKMIPGQN